jgi:predicted membrane protein
MTDPFLPTTPKPAAERPIGQLVFGVVLVVIGAGWLITALDLFTIPWRGVMAAILILIGVTLVVTASGERPGGLIAIGVTLTLLLATITSVEGLAATPLRCGIGERTFTPATVAELRDEYRLAIGQLEVGLRRVDFPPGETTVTASVTIGQLVVSLPDDVAVKIEGSITAG